jgi:hypothetical protein
VCYYLSSPLFLVQFKGIKTVLRREAEQLAQF